MKPAPKAIPIGLQLYSVRAECAKDLPGAVQAVAKMGYQGVEFAGYYGRSAADLRKMLDDLGLRCCGTHIGLPTLLGDALQPTIEFNLALGNRFLIVPSLPPERRSSKQAWLDTAKLFDEVAEKLRPHGLRVGYHNHTAEFTPLEGEIPWDIFCANTRKEVVTQLDIGHAARAGHDPVAVLKRYPGRAATVHVRDHSAAKPGALIGEGEIKWKEFIQTCRTAAGTEWFIIEQEGASGLTPMDAVSACLANLKKLLV
jgi:sugar phosphate isomerase/epimerase